MTKEIKKIGLIGGLGPLASAFFVERIYSVYLQNAFWQKKYHLPYIYLYSEPLITQSTPLISLKHTEMELFEKLENNVEQLLIQQEVECIIICCFTAHLLLPKLRSIYQNKILSLVTLVLNQVLAEKEDYIILSASSTREAKVFETHPLWHQASAYITFISDEQQKQLNLFIQIVKQNALSQICLEDFLNLIKSFSGHKLLICCAELHLLYHKLQKNLDFVFDCFDEAISLIFNRSLKE